jgi:EAL domain-containing protein (putative c-di-GMP-specific phosphodiesterase class I)
MTNIIDLSNSRHSFATQPIVKLSTDEVVAHEVLLRQFKTKTIFDFNNKPSLFVEHSVSLAQCIAELQRKLTEKGVLKTVFVNFCPEQISNDNFIKCLDMFYHNGIVPSSIAIEITENLLPKETESFYANLEWARGNGHPLIVDDFGAGISNFDHVSRIRPAIIKTDMSLIKQAEVCRHSKRCLRALINYLTEIGAKSVVEGIETKKQKNIAEEVGATFGQGYYFEEPTTHTFQLEDAECVPKQHNIINFKLASVLNGLNVNNNPSLALG